jgi:hypothetical protein
MLLFLCLMLKNKGADSAVKKRGCNLGWWGPYFRPPFHYVPNAHISQAIAPVKAATIPMIGTIAINQLNAPVKQASKPIVAPPAAATLNSISIF